MRVGGWIICFFSLNSGTRYLCSCTALHNAGSVELRTEQGRPGRPRQLSPSVRVLRALDDVPGFCQVKNKWFGVLGFASYYTYGSDLGVALSMCLPR